MTKSTKHKKEFRKEKNKIKLKLTFKAEKSGKRKKGQLLPKGLNVTDTSFKSKKIVLPDHLRPSEDSGVPLNHRKQTFKELLAHMGHFNAGVQQDGINGMKELLVKFPAVLDVSLSSLLSKVSELMSVRDAPVRKCALKLLEHIIQSTSAENIAPFFPLLNARLVCCMNHISLDIQKDSHLLLDILLNHVPGLVSTATMQILPNFLEQISSRDISKGDRRVLTINPTQRLTSLKWRQEVLTRVNQLLILLLEKNQTEYQSNTVDIVFDHGKSCPLYMKRNFDVRLNIQKPGHLSVNDSNSPSLHIQGFASQILPLLIETWVEAMASEQLNKDQANSLVGIESIALLTCISNVMFTLLSIMKQSENHLELLNWFQLEYGESLIRNFIRPFPFSARLESSRSKKQAIDPQCRDQNLIICFLWAQLETKSAAKCAELVFQYLSGLLQAQDVQFGSAAIELDKLKEIFFDKKIKPEKRKLQISNILDAMRKKLPKVR
ncbi:testis-expressed protein 10-like [Daphnia carinata]|uniref:testis-expressed protein 10-like n=1 Tax=Daphnia carinata TaxID=120202 RepID=UPI002580E4B8|nr:testis-expressed protein 10-like [Daphnia carinata]